MDSCTDYLQTVLKPPFAKIIADKTTALIQDNICRGDYDCIVFRGVSGALIAPIVAYKLGVPVVPVRKGENSHSSNLIELVGDYVHYLVVDDLISSGDTMREILTVCNRHSMHCRGIVLWNENEWAQVDPATVGCDGSYDYGSNIFWPYDNRPSEKYSVYCVGRAADYTKSFPEADDATE